MTDRPVIAIVHSTTASIAPATEAFAREFPQARLWNLLDDRLGADADELGAVALHLRRRMLGLVRHGIDGGADAVLIACSMYGGAVAVAEQLWTTPVFASDLDMMDELARMRPARVAVLASLESAATDSSDRLRTHLEAQGANSDVIPVFCEGAAAAGNHDLLVKALAAGIEGETFDVLAVAQYSLSPAAGDLAEVTGLRVVNPPLLAARAVRERLGSRS
ncbi:aspartate/glutamate racemase family protein [Rhodococcus opacus]|uniref:aspartate/glutamate racemase family protein n=1 Tax=Rhodococcus opacus TaxID=37919 RepID=UPI001C487D76|nr:aspartate/glutamate racemase family protein [Rhodococcus opacus]MBV6759173.1 aspartate/glutamate racemase family protein [Rhodococcus opacus]